MINDLESNIMKIENTESTSDKFPLKRINFPALQDNSNILCMSSSKKNIFLITDRAELLLIESKTLNPIRQSYSIIPEQTSTPSGPSSKFKENITKIWTDRAGNHCIIRFSGKIYYFNSSFTNIKELNIFKSIEITAIGFDDNNNNPLQTGNFLAADYNNNIYECSITIEKKGTNDYNINDNIEIVTTISFKDWDYDDDEEYSEPKSNKNEKIYGIKFLKSAKNKKEIKPNEDIIYIMAVTKTRIYEFKGPGEKSFKQTFAKYNYNDNLFNDSCKYFPPSNNVRRRNFGTTDLDILYRNDRIDQFGWKTDSGFCFGNFSFYGLLPEEIKKFTVVPFAKINNEGNKETDLEPLSVTHTQNHIFILYNDCLTIISKLTSNIIHTQYFQCEYNGLLYNEFYEKNGNILLSSRGGLYQISLKDENKDIWQDYLDIGDYSNAQRCAEDNTKLIKKINRINADEDYEKKDYFNSAVKYIESDEKFEIICLKYLMKNQIDALKYYLELYLSKNVDVKEEIYKIECNLITSLLIEIFLNKSKSEKKKTLEEFRQIIREKRKYLLEGNIISYLLLSYGKMDEYVEFCSLMGDHESAILYYINNRDYDLALEKLTEFSSYTDDIKTLEVLEKIFLNNCHAFFKNNPKESILLLKQRFKNIKMEYIIQSIISTTDKDINTDITNKSGKSKGDENSQAILNYLKSLVEKPKTEEENNIHNLYIYYLSRNKTNQEAIIDYLKRPLKLEDDQFNFNPKKKEVLFQLDYAKKLFKDNPPAFSLVLALMGKYSEGVKTALKNKTPECQKIAKFIASNAPDEKLRKQLWIDIFSCDSQNEFEEALKIMKESKILKIEDVLPHITDTIKIEEFKKQISSCINDYEKNIKRLKTDIDEYNKTAENIKNDIIKIKKKSMEIQYSNCKCEICQGYIKEKNIFLFPCGHMFDARCIRQCLLDYEATGLESIHDKNKRIDELFYEIGIEKEKSFINTKKTNTTVEKEIEEKKQEEQRFGNALFNKLKINIDIPQVFKKQDVPEDKNVKDIKKLKAELNALLSEQCVLCGDYMVDSIQCSICRPDVLEPHSDGTKLRLKSRSSWEYI